ncbi:MAG TPA: FkbM family methyltransferase [Planctomycetota bacterium]|nr:FkbM family methyltransferase [Planctomycetota bacterium]
MNLVQKVIRHVHVPYYALKLLAETLRAWGFSKWVAFWCSDEENVPLTMDGLRFLVRASSIKSKMTDTFAIMESLYHHLYSRRFYDDEFRIDPEDVVVDIGGYVGSFALPAARLATRGRIYSFEPSPSNYEQFVKNLALNQLPNVKVFNQGVASSDRKITLFLDNMNPASNSIYLRTDQNRGNNYVEKEAVSLAAIFAREGIARCDFLKIDCEGAEYEILMNLDRSMLDRIGKIACEYHQPAYYGVTNPDHTPEKLARFLEQSGFAVYLKPVNPYLGMMYAANHRPAAPAAS